MKRPIKDMRHQTIGYIDEKTTGTAVYNAKYQKLGEIKKEGGKLIAKDAHFRKIAEYDEKLNVTKNAHFKQIGKGNLLVDILLS